MLLRVLFASQMTQVRMGGGGEDERKVKPKKLGWVSNPFRYYMFHLCRM